MENGSSAELLRVGFSIGEPGGIGPQLLLEFLEGEGWQEAFIPVVFGHRKVIERWRNHLGLRSLRYHLVRSPDEAKPAQLNLIECGPGVDFPIGKPTPEGGTLARESFCTAVAQAQAGTLDLLVTLPVDKSSFFHETTFPYRGHTEYLRAVYPDTPPLMVMVSDGLKVGVVTEHIPLRSVAEQLTADQLRWAVQTLKQGLQADFAILAPRIAVLGLNPHAGDGGLIGTEESEWIAPTLQALREEGYLVGGPFSPDGFFGARAYQQVDAVLALYHDQGLIPFKLLVGWEGFQWSAGLPFVRTAPDHGVAYDRVGSEAADRSSLAAAVWEGLAMVRRRRSWKESQTEPA